MDFRVPRTSGPELKKQVLKSRSRADAVIGKLTLRVAKLIEYSEHKRQTKLKTLKSVREAILNEMSENKLAAEETPAWNRYFMEFRDEKIKVLIDLNKEIESLE